MFKKNYIVKINLPGGIVGAGDLYAIVEAAARARVQDMQFGGRQQLFCKVSDRYGKDFLRELDLAGIFYETGKEQHPNIVSSYVTEGVFGKPQWVSEGLYKDILQGFDFRPRLKVSLVDSGQSFVPFFTSHLNFISSAVNNHWHLVVRHPGTNRLYHWKTVIYSPDISRVSRLIEEQLIGPEKLAGAEQPIDPQQPANPEPPTSPKPLTGPRPDPGSQDWGQHLYNTVCAQGLSSQGPEPPALQLPLAGVPYYEGFNRTGTKHWLGIYRREELFPLDFLKDVCLLALQTKIGQLYTTPWKSLLVKGIEDQDIPRWEYALGKYRINVRHASNELNWQTEDLCPEGLRLKRYLSRHLDQDDVRTEGLSFAIKTRQGSGIAGSIIIRKQDEIRPGQWKLLDRYSIWHTPDFDPHAMEAVLYRNDIEKENLFPYLVSLCKEFYHHQSARLPSSPSPDTARTPGTSGHPASSLQCLHCLTVYDEQYGDPEQGVAPGTPFREIHADWVCPLCGGPKADFNRVDSGVHDAPATR